MTHWHAASAGSGLFVASQWLGIEGQGAVHEFRVMERTGPVRSLVHFAAVHLSPWPQHFEASHVVSELHAMDGGTLYGMPHGPLAPTQQLVPGIVNTDRVNGVLNAFKIWAQAAELRPPTAQLPLPPLGPRSQVALCMRMARVFVDMLETRGSAAGGSGAAAAATTAVAAASGRRQVRSGQAGRGASVDGGGGSGAAAAVVLLVPPAECLSACLTALNSAVIIMACHTWQGGGKGGGGAVGDAGESPGQGAMAGSLEWICGKPTAGEVDWLFHRLAIRATWLRRGAFAREWWPLVVPAVHAQLDSVPAGGLGADRDPTTSRVLALLMLPSMGGKWASCMPRDMQCSPEEGVRQLWGHKSVCWGVRLPLPRRRFFWLCHRY